MRQGAWAMKATGRIFILLLALFLPAQGARADAVLQSLNGPGATAILSLYSDSAGTRYAGTQQAVYRMQVGETSWSALGTGLPANASVRAITRDAAGQVYAGTGIAGVYALDANGSWIAANTGFPVSYTGIFAFAWDNGQLYAATGYGVYRRDANSGSWLGLGLNGVYAIAFDAAHTLYAGLYYNGVWKLPSGGQNWQDASSGLPSGTTVNSLVFDVAGNLIAGTEARGLYKLNTGTSNWSAFNSGASADATINQLASDGAGGAYALVKNGGLLKMAAVGSGWAEISPALPLANASSLLAASNGELLAGTVAGTYKRAATGEWTPIRAGLPIETVVNALVFDGSGNLYAASDEVGVSLLAVGSTVWQDINTGIPRAGLAKSLVIDKQGNLFAALFGAGVFRRAAGSSTWTAWNTGLDNYPVVNSMSVSPAGEIYAAASAIGGYSNGIYRLPAGGSQWSMIGGTLPNNPPLRAVAVGTDGTVYVGTSAGLTNTGTFGGVYRLASGQSSWSEFNTGMGKVEVGALAVDKNGNLYAATSGTVFVLAKGGTSWSSTGSGLPASFYGYANALSLDAAGNLFLGTSEGAFVLNAGGSSWARSLGMELGGFPTNPVFAIAVGTGGYAMGTSGRGVFGARSGLGFGTGWNLIGNGDDALLDVAATFGDASSVITVWKWVANSSRWAFFAPTLIGQALTDYAASKGYDVLSTINGGEGFWVNAKQAFAAPRPAGSTIVASSFASSGTRPLGLGWNLIAIGETKTPSEFNIALSGLSVVPPNPADIPVNLTTLWAWDSVQSGWYFYAPSLEKSGGLTNYIVNKGYLDFPANNKKLGPGVGFWVNKP